MESANANFFHLGEKGIRKDLMYDLASRCGFKVLSKTKNDVTQYRLKKVGIPCERLYTREDKTTINFIDIADLHIGNSDCEISKIRNVLDYAVRQNVDYVFSAGDILDGVFSSMEIRDAQVICSKQIDAAYSIFRNYPLDIRVVPGNHDFTFDFVGIRNPLRILEEKLKNEKCNFKVYDGYIQDFEMAGIVKRMMHLENFYLQDNVVAVIQRLHEFKEHGGLMVKCEDGVKRPLRFLECGHIHKTAEMYDWESKVTITQPGSFVYGQNYYMPFIHVKGEVLDDLRIVRD